MVETFVALLAGHLIGDFVIQTNSMATQKERLGILFLHATLVTGMTLFVVGELHVPILLVVFTSHVVIDSVKTRLMPDTFVTFIADQATHAVVLFGAALAFHDALTNGVWMTLLSTTSQHQHLIALTGVSGFLLCVPFGGVLIEKLILPLYRELDAEVGGLPRGGQYIGWLERSIVFLLLFINLPNGIGFLIAAKSILRFGEVRDPSTRKTAEYIIIGTFLSFGWALLISVLTQQAIVHWQS